MEPSITPDQAEFEGRAGMLARSAKRAAAEADRKFAAGELEEGYWCIKDAYAALDAMFETLNAR